MRSLIVALDLPTAEAAVATAEALADSVDAFAIGPPLLLGPGPLIISALVRIGKPVVADARLHDTPARCAEAARQLGKHGARWVTAHAAGGQEMLEATVAGLSDGAGVARSGVLAVTVLPSLDRGALARVGIDRSPGKLVAQMSKAAAAAGCEGVVCPASELAVVRDSAPALIRVADLAGAPGEATVEDLVERGADAVIAGVCVTGSDDPIGTATSFSEMMRRTSTDD